MRDAVEYMLDNAVRILSKNYDPTSQDIMRLRVRTTGLVETLLEINPGSNTLLRIVDVGGQRNERRKWINAFECVKVIIFIVSVVDYDRYVTYVDKKTGEEIKINRLYESLSVFQDVVNNRFLHGASIILFVNKMDLLAEKLAREGDTGASLGVLARVVGCEIEELTPTVKSVSQSIQNAFSNVFQASIDSASNRQMHVYETTATETESVRNVFTACKNVIMGDVLGSFGVL